MAGRKVADCRLFPSEKNCTLTIAGSEEEVMKAAVLKEQVRAMLKDE
jgi:hypothetical protein